MENRPVTVMIPIELLRPHPKQDDYFKPLDNQMYSELKADIEKNGIQTPLLVKPDYTIISGHQRHKVAIELGIKLVPVIFKEADDEESERILIADNLLRRHLTPMELSNLASILKEKFGVKYGARRPKGIPEIANIIGQSERTTHRLLKLQDLIPPLKELVSSGKLTTTAAEQLAYLSAEAQGELYQVLGDQISEMKAAEIKGIRQKEVKLRQDNEESYQAFLRLQEQVTQLQQELKATQKAGGDINALKQQIEELEKQRNQLEYTVIDYDNARQELKKREDPGTSFMRQVTKIINPLWESAALIEELSKAVHEDPYGTLAENMQRNANLLNKIANILEETADRITKAG